MRPVGMTLAASLLVALVARAQPPAGAPAPGAPGVPGVPVGPAPAAPPAAPPGAPAADPKFDAHLAGWEKTMSGVVNFHAKFELKRTEAVFKKDRVYSGSVLCMKPNFARLRLDNTANKDDYEAYICNGASIFEYNGLQKTITEFKLTPGQGGAGDNLMLDFLSGMKAADAKRRFQLSVFNEDANYVYLDIKPTLPKDRQEFEQVRFALFGPNVKAPFTPYLPVQVYLAKPNGDVEMWTFSGQQTNVPGVGPQQFQFVPVQGWAVKQAPAVPPPTSVPPPAGAAPMGLAPRPGAAPPLPGGTNLPAGPGAVKP